MKIKEESFVFHVKGSKEMIQSWFVEKIKNEKVEDIEMMLEHYAKFTIAEHAGIEEVQGEMNVEIIKK